MLVTTTKLTSLMLTHSSLEDLSLWELVDRQRDPFRTVSYLDHGLDLGFAITYHKIQVLAQRIPAVLLFLPDPNLLRLILLFILRDELFSASSWT